MVSIAGVGITYAILCAGATVTFTYVVDCYRSVAGEAVSILIAFRNSMSFGLSFAIFPWLEKDGFIKVRYDFSNRLACRHAVYTDTSCSLGHRLHDLDPGRHFSVGNPDVRSWTKGSRMDKYISSLRSGSGTFLRYEVHIYMVGQRVVHRQVSSIYWSEEWSVGILYQLKSTSLCCKTKFKMSQAKDGLCLETGNKNECQHPMILPEPQLAGRCLRRCFHVPYKVAYQKFELQYTKSYPD